MSQNEDPSLGDVIRSVHATGEDRFGIEHGQNPRDSNRAHHPLPDDEDDDEDEEGDDVGAS
jgi:hypothetical protein